MSNLHTFNMNLVIPGIGTEPGPEWAEDINTSFNIVDVHDHSPGNGVPITPDGMSITGDLAINSNNLTTVRSLRLSAISLGTVTASDVGCLLESGVDLYYIDGNGNQVRITNGGSVAGATGSISGLTSPASASFSTDTFTFQSDSNVAANLDVASIIVRKTTASSAGITVSAPTALASSYTMTLLATAPASTSFLSIDSSGNLAATVAVNAGITSTNIAAGGVSRPNLVAVGQQVSSVINFSVSSMSFVAVTGLTVTITTTGRPVIVMLQADAGTTSGGLVSITGGSTSQATLGFTRSSIGLNLNQVYGPTSILQLAPSQFILFDPVAAGTWVYGFVVRSEVISQTIAISNIKMIAYEL